MHRWSCVPRGRPAAHCARRPSAARHVLADKAYRSWPHKFESHSPASPGKPVPVLRANRRTRDDLQHLRSRGLLLQRFAQLVEQPRVLYGDDDLGGEILDQIYLFIVERPDLLAIDSDRTN